MREWVEQALCRQIGGDFWYADDQKSFEEQNIAKRVCQMCPVQVQCLQHALATDEKYGIWGGVTARNRANMRRAKWTG